MEPIYLDHNSTSPPFPETVAALAAAWKAPHGNPASQHAIGRQARRRLEDAREEIVGRLGGDAASHHRDTLVFTSGATEANNLALFGLVPRWHSGRVILSAVEHPSVREPALELGRHGWKATVLAVDSAGRVDPAELEARIEEEQPSWVSVQFANHETGVVQPIAELAKIAARYGVPIHCDATQAAGKVALSLRDLGLSAMTFSAHKFQGPVGVGGLLANGVEVAPRNFGGFQQGGVRPGTEAVPPVLGMLAALRKWDAERDALAAELASKRDHFEARLREAIDGLAVNGLDGPDGSPIGPVERLPQTSNLSFPRVDRQAFLMALDLAWIACSTGSACASGSPEPSPVLAAMRLPPERVRGALRFSFGPQTSPAEVDEAVERIVRVHRSLARP